MISTPVSRNAVRAILLNREDQILLIGACEPSGRTFWHTPGGGIEDGESALDALKRELFEEVGLAEYSSPIFGWERVCSFSFDGKAIAQQEKYFIVRAENFTPTDRFIPTDAEKVVLTERRWFGVEELGLVSEIVFPEDLAVRLRAILCA